jgi:hypothetical protein
LFEKVDDNVSLSLVNNEVVVLDFKKFSIMFFFTFEVQVEVYQ